MASQLVGKWKLESSENFDQYMHAVGVGKVMAKLGSTAKPTIIISVDGDVWSVRTETTFKTHEIHFKIGEEFDETTADGRKVRTTCTLEDGKKLIQSQQGDVPSTLTRELIDDNTLQLTCEAKNVVSKRMYKRC